MLPFCTLYFPKPVKFVIKLHMIMQHKGAKELCTNYLNAKTNL